MPPTLSRRYVLRAFGLAWSGGLATACAQPVATTPQPAVTPSVPPITQPSPAGHAAFAAYAEQMRRIAVASGDQAFGAVVVKHGQVVGLGPSRVVVNNDPTAHAEMEAIRDACRRLGVGDLTGGILYSTSRPCPMCEAAAAWARVGRMMHGPNAAAAGAPRLCSV